MSERRHAPRITPKGTVHLVIGGHTLHGRLVNLSAGGFLARTPVTVPERSLGRTVEITLRFDGRGSEWLHMTGRILRIGASEIAISIDDQPPNFNDVLATVGTAAPRDSVVLIDATPSRRRTFAEAFRTAGCDVIEVATPLEAIVRLGESTFEPMLIAIADSLPSSTSDDLRSFVQREHPDARLVTIGDDLEQPLGIDHWLSSTAPDLLTRVSNAITRIPRR